MNFDWKEYLALAHFLQQHSVANLATLPASALQEAQMVIAILK